MFCMVQRWIWFLPQFPWDAKAGTPPSLHWGWLVSQLQPFFIWTWTSNQTSSQMVLFQSILPTILALTAAALAKLWEHHWDQSVRWQHHIRRWCNICLPHTVLMIISPIMTISNLNLNPQVFRNIENHKSHNAPRRRVVFSAGLPTPISCANFAHGGASGAVAAGRQNQSGLWEINEIVLERSWKHRKYGYESYSDLSGCRTGKLSMAMPTLIFDESIIDEWTWMGYISWTTWILTIRILPFGNRETLFQLQSGSKHSDRQWVCTVARSAVDAVRGVLQVFVTQKAKDDAASINRRYTLW